jgi:hypothetical protein
LVADRRLGTLWAQIAGARVEKDASGEADQPVEERSVYQTRSEDSLRNERRIGCIRFFKESVGTFCA